ncbi:MAG: hypothetical protein Q4B50_06115, partial [Bacillota bacterium]|nr:hypothetical protein [Bacillota bacterium]
EDFSAMRIVFGKGKIINRVQHSSLRKLYMEFFNQDVFRNAYSGAFQRALALDRQLFGKQTLSERKTV